MNKKHQTTKDLQSGLLQSKSAADRMASIAEALPDAKPETRQAVKPESQTTGAPLQEETVTVGAKVYKTLANHWTVEAKRQRRSVSEVIRQALVEAFGLPDDFPPEAVKPENRKTVKTD